MALIEDLMKTKLVIAGPKETVRQVSSQMDQNGVGAVLVVEGSGDTAELRGLFSERDLLHRVVVAGLDPETTPIESVMTKEPITVGPETHIRKCAELIRERGFRHLPVVHDGRPIGILSARDFQQYIVAGLESFIDQARYREALEEGHDPYNHMGGSYSK
jgi:CBS domain-containing protein